MQTILAIDPGTTESAFVVTDGKTLVDFGKIDNRQLLSQIKQNHRFGSQDTYIEMIASYGMPVGREVFETCVWIGRFWQALAAPPKLVYRKDVKLTVCHDPRANDASIRQALIDRFGPGKEKAIGTKKNPGPLYGVTKDVWAALAVAITALEQREEKGRVEEA